MKSILRTLIVWLVLLAMPLAGFASAATSCCPPGSGHVMPQAQAGLQHQAGSHQHGCGEHNATQDHTSKHDARCANCAACCTAAMAAPLAFAPPPVMPPPASHAIAFDLGRLPNVDLDHPERPPRFTRA